MIKLLLMVVALSFVACSDVKNNQESMKFDVYYNYDEALKLAKEQNRAIFLLFTSPKCRWCEKLKTITLNEPIIVERLKSEFIFLLLDKNRDSYPQKYSVKGVPAVYLLNHKEEVYTTILGYHENPNDYIKWFNYIKIENED